MASSNPFATFSNSSHSSVGKNDQTTELTDSPLRKDIDSIVKEKVAMSYCIERIFLITLDNDDSGSDSRRPSHCVFLEELHSMLEDQEWLDLENMSHAMFERTLMAKGDLVKSLVAFDAKKSDASLKVTESRSLWYLYHCYVRACQENQKIYAEKCKSIILECSSTCLRQPDLYCDQNIPEQFKSLFFEEFFGSDSETLLSYLQSVLVEVEKEEGIDVVYSYLQKILSALHEHFLKGLLGKLCALPDASQGLKMLQFFSSSETLAKLLIRYNVETSSTGVYEKSFLGSILSSSCAPNAYAHASDLFSNPSKMTQTDVDRAENMASMNTDMIVSTIYDLFMAMCKRSSSVRSLLLMWIGELLHANYGRVKLASTMSPLAPAGNGDCSDGLMINLASVLLRMCVPFSKPKDPKLLKIQPVYCRHVLATEEDRRSVELCCRGLPEQTFLVPLEKSEIDDIVKPSEYGFITNLYYLTQLSLYLGVHSTHEKFISLNRELNNLEQVYRAQQQSAGPDYEAVKFMFEQAMRKYLAMKAVLTDPVFLKPALKFHIASGTYITYLAIGGDNIKPFSILKFPLETPNTHLLGCMPEFVLTNIIDVMAIARRLKSSVMAEVVEFSNHVMDLILVFMGSTNRVKSPHLRAELAHVLSELMPNSERKAATYTTSMLDMVKERVFIDHPHIENLAEVLLSVFVGIETTGQAVQFEQKFSYRQPMYKVIDFIWKIRLHQDAIMRLHDDTMNHLEDSSPPLFLRFTHLLVDDAHLLLDDALDYMKKIRDAEIERQERQIPLQGRELQQYESNLAHMTNLARFHNMAAIDTTHTLALLTSKCKALFCEGVMVDRISSMLNYFLDKLTGKRTREFKVTDFDRYHFKPSVVVSEICQIYLNLSDSEKFCKVLTADGRSFSSKLLPQARDVLTRTGEAPEKVQAFQDFIDKVMKFAEDQVNDDDIEASAPEEFIDQFTGKVMEEPVMLPTSKTILDKSSIARHLLSNQIDPFNRTPLTLDQVIPQPELKARIQEWRQSARKQT